MAVGRDRADRAGGDAQLALEARAVRRAPTPSSSMGRSTITVPSRMKLPNFGWMTLRWMPMCPSPAATATGLCETTQILSRELRHLHGKAHRGVQRGDALASRAATRVRAMSLTSSPVWWNSRFATERAGERIGSRFIRTTKLTSARARGKARRMSSRWSSSSGRSSETKPTSSAPASRAIDRSRLAWSEEGLFAICVHRAGSWKARFRLKAWSPP